MLTVCTFLWDGEVPYRQCRYTGEHVRTLASMCERHLPPHRFVCFADRNVDGVETVPIDERVLTWGKRYPKLLFWSDLGINGHMLCLDLDAVIVDDLAPMLDESQDVTLWQDPGYRHGVVYNTSMIWLRAGSRTQVWHTFPGPGTAKRGKGTDQSWVRQALGPDVPMWTPQDGIYSYKYQINGELPDNARIVFFHGRPKPWELDDAWIREHYR